MKKRKGFSKTQAAAKETKPVDENSWRAELEAISINDDNWWCIVTMMVETTTEHSRCVSLFNTAAEEGKRKAIYSLSSQQMVASVKMLSKTSLDKCPTIQGVCHYASKFLIEDNAVIPAWLVAQIIKLLIYRIKEETIGIVKRMADLEHEIDEEYRIMQTVADWGQPGSKSFNAEKLNNKAITRLRKRGEEWRDMVYVDDAPLNGPNLYIILSGFHDPDLLEHLLNAGVPLSFIMRIKRSNRDLDRLAEYGTIQKFEKSRNMYRFGVYNSCMLDLYRFWSKIETRMMDPEAHPTLLDVAIQHFRPPELPEIFHDNEYEHLKKNLYDEVSYFMYDLYDLYRQHRNYLESMMIERAVVDDTERKCDTETYRAVLDGVPQECISLPLILFAILAQIDANDRRNLIEGRIEGTDAHNDQQMNTDMQEDREETKHLGTLVEETIRTLNAKYRLDHADSDSDEEEPITHIELILREDALNEIIRFFDDCTNSIVLDRTDLADNLLRVFWHPNIMGLHEEHNITKKNLYEYSRHIDKLRRHLDIVASSEEVIHYLHVLMFDRIIFGPAQDLNQPVDRSLEEHKLTSFLSINQPPTSMKRSKSVPSFTLKFDERIQFYSDGNIEYGKSLPFVVDCGPLFAIIDPRELLVPDYLQENVYSFKYKNRDGLKEFNDVELLPKSIFMQRVQQCLVKYDSCNIHYFEPTDSVLLCFGDEWRANRVHEEERMSSIRTPVRLRDFCEHVVPEEQDWILREEQEYRLLTSELLKRLMKKAAQLSDEKLLFTDEDFILPWSLKASDLAKRNADTDLLPPIYETSEESEKEKDEKKKSMKKKKQKETKSNVDAASSRMSKKSRSRHTIQEEASYEFIGYDLGRLRVHVRNRKTVFLSAGGARVEVEMDDWLYKNKDLRITVTIQDYSLHLFHRINNPKFSEVFHLTSPLGIVLAFEKLSTLGDVTSSSFTTNWSNRGFDFRGSWPSGLLIEPIIGDSQENPFYICQSYVRNSCSSARGIHEVCRKFLRNGTVLKYLDDGKIIVLCPNGDIVTCIAFKKLQANEHRTTKDEISSGKGDRPTKGPGKSKSKPTSSLKSRMVEVDRGDSAWQISRTDSDNVRSTTDATVKVSRYTVADYHGRQYEVLDDLVVSEDHRLLVRTASDYEVDEKFTRRGDGTDMLLNSNGELIVGFSDGTRIMTGYTVEKEPVMCDWTEEEVVRFFGSGSTEEDDYADGSFSNLNFHGEASSGIPEYDDIGEILIADSFVSVLLTCRAEHKNYATVFYDQSAVSCTLSMPDDLRVSISRRGHYKVSMADGVNLKIEDDALSFEGNTCATCGSQSTSTYNFFPSELLGVVFTSVDVCGNIFEVKDDGTTRYRGKSQPSGRQKFRSDIPRSSEEEEEEGEGEEVEEEEEEHFERNENFESFENGCDHVEDYNALVPSRCRLFSMNRDLTAYEYHHRSIKDQVEADAVLDNEASVILYPAPRRSKLPRLITLETVKPESRSKAMLSFREFKVRPTNFDRTDLIRSTYSIPYDWMFPFGRKGNGIWKNTHDLPFLCETDKTVPKLLETRILYGFKEPGENAVINIQKALGQYWMSLVSGTNDPATPTQSVDTQEDVKAIFDSLENDLHDLSLGIKKTVDVATYRYSMEKRLAQPGEGKRESRISIEFNELLRQKAAKRKELEWYKRCFKEKFYLPYFQNIEGACFLWVLECVENAPKISQAIHPLEEHERYCQIQEIVEELHDTKSDTIGDHLMPEPTKRWITCFNCNG